MQQYIKLLCSDKEKAVARKIDSPKDFKFLHDQIYARLNLLVSVSTLKRIWGYVEHKATPRESTLSIFAQYLGYRDFYDYVNRCSTRQEVQSSPVIHRKLVVEEELCVGDKVRLTWQPMRVCDVEYLGLASFRVISSVNTRLTTGDTFRCTLIIEHEPLYIDDLHHGDLAPMTYVCGKRDGVTFERL